MNNYNRQWLGNDLLDRFLRYVKIDTTSDRHVEAIPSTRGQWHLLKILEEELREFEFEDVRLNKNGYLIARIPNRGLAGDPDSEGKDPWEGTIGLMAHID